MKHKDCPNNYPLGAKENYLHLLSPSPPFTDCISFPFTIWGERAVCYPTRTKEAKLFFSSSL